MNKDVIEQERSIRIATPELHKKMIETFEPYHIHPFDVQGTVIKNKNGYDVKLTFTNTFSKSVSAYFNFNQVKSPDEKVTKFFNETAEECKSHLIKNYYKMIKP